MYVEVVGQADCIQLIERTCPGKSGKQRRGEFPWVRGRAAPAKVSPPM